MKTWFAKHRKYSPIDKVVMTLKADENAGIKHESLEVNPEFFVSIIKEYYSMKMLREPSEAHNFEDGIRICGVMVYPRRAT